MQTLLRRIDLFFPEREIAIRRIPFKQQVGLFLLFFAIFSAAGTLIPADGFFAFDWVNFFSKGNIPVFYPPWTIIVTRLLTWPTLVGLTLATVGIASFQRARHPLNLFFVFLSLPVFWTVFLGQLDGLALLGITGLPWLAPLALIKPQIAVFGFLARKSSIAWLVAILLLSFLIWGFWPTNMFSIWTIHSEGKYINDISIGLYGLPLALVLMWFSRGDVDMLVLAGCFTTPYLLPYGLIVVAPAIARLPPWTATIAWILSWMPLSANWLGSGGWWLGWLFIGWLWVVLAIIRYQNSGIRQKIQRMINTFAIVPSKARDNGKGDEEIIANP